MAYATIADLIAYNPARQFTQNTKPTGSQVSEFIAWAAGMIDTKLRTAGYDTPVATNAASSVLLLLKDTNALGALYRSEWAAEQSDKRKEAEDMWMSALKMLSMSDLDLAKNTSESNPRGSVAGQGSAFFHKHSTF